MDTKKSNNIDKEIIALNASATLINDMVNYSIFTRPEGNEDVTLLPNTEVHLRLFNILLVEFLSGPRQKTLGLEPLPKDQRDHGYLYYLQNICLKPSLNINGQKNLEKAIKDFISWLDGECVVEKVWLPSINRELKFKIPRVSFLKICGDISKHGFLRLDQRIKELKYILKKNSVFISIDQTYLVLPEFYDWFHRDIFNYHLSNIAEFLNNINWGIYEYIESIRKDINSSDNYTSPLVKSMYYDLKNFKPYMPRFKVTKYLKMRY